jgi:uncharacterized protein (TIGR00299 family) protein
MRVLYVDGFSGASGDMILGALLDLGVPLEAMEGPLRKLPLGPWQIKVATEARHHLHGTRVQVHVPVQSHQHRSHAHIREMLLRAELPQAVRDRSLKVFQRLAGAEARIHRKGPDQVTFHEVGAVDSIVDIVGAVLGFEHLRPDKVVVSPLPLGRGFVESQHGKLPVPAPATLELLSGVPVYEGDVQAEMVTPTAAAILTELAQEFGALPPMRPEKVGYGVGSRDLPQMPNLLRMILGQEGATGLRQDWVLEANIDDMNPQFCEHLIERLLAGGALDVGWCPMIMKRGRPGGLLRVLVESHRKDSVAEIILQESTSIGVRGYPVLRQCLERRFQTVQTPWGEVRLKVCSWGERVLNALPEYQDCRDIALKTGVPLKEVYSRALCAYHQGQGGEGS